MSTLIAYFLILPHTFFLIGGTLPLGVFYFFLHFSPKTSEPQKKSSEWVESYFLYRGEAELRTTCDTIQVKKNERKCRKTRPIKMNKASFETKRFQNNRNGKLTRKIM